MKILAIDTSCDDTSIAILDIKRKEIRILSNIISSQIKVHQKYGGVYPTLAKREHQKNLAPTLKQALKKAKLFGINSKTDKIAVTVGPGLEPCLWIGVNFAKSLAHCWNLPIIPVNHIEGHLLANLLPQISSNFQFSIFNFQKFLPAIGLVVSGGHTQLILIKKINDYKIIGETRDDAAGECFDKTARTLGLPYPGGPAIAAEAAKLSMINDKLSINLPRPMINSKNYDFSFSGLKTAVLYDFKKRPEKIRSSKKYVQVMAREIQQSIIDVLIKKTIKSVQEYKVKTIILGGGVAANEELRKQFQLKIKNLKLEINFLVPSKILCTDNAAMIGIAGYFNQKKATKDFKKIKVKANLRLP